MLGLQAYATMLGMQCYFNTQNSINAIHQNSRMKIVSMKEGTLG
jgi:hypothetical protein